MARLPYSDFTATTAPTGKLLGTGRRVRAAPEAFGADVGQALQVTGRETEGIAERELRAKEQHEQREVQLNAARITTEFDEALNEAAKTGADLNEVREKYEEQLGEIQDNLETSAGTFQAQAAFERGRSVYAGLVRQAEAKRVGLQASNQVSELKDILAKQVLKNPDALPIAQDEIVKLIDTFSLSPGEKREMADVTDRELAQTAATSMLESDPARLKSLLLDGGIKGLNPGDQAQFLSQANTALESAARKTKTKDNEAKFQLSKAMSARATLGLVSDNERSAWFDEGASAAQFISMQESAQKIHDARVELAQNSEKVGMGLGASLPKDKYQDAVTHYVQDVVEGDTPEVAGRKAVDTRIDLSIRNGKEDNEIATAMNAGAIGGENAFTLGAMYYNEFLTKKPTLGAKMADESTEYVYDAYNFYRSEMDLSDEQARQTSQAALLERGQIATALKDKENRELIEDALEDLTTIDEVFTDNRYVREQLISRTQKFLAYQPRLSVEQALKLAQEQFERHNVQLEPGYWVENKGIPEDALTSLADNSIRLQINESLKAQGLPELNIFLLRRLHFIPLGDGNARILHPDTGQVLIPNFPWQEARDRWWTESSTGKKERDRQQALLELQAAQRLERQQQDRARFLEQKETLSGADLTPQALIP